MAPALGEREREGVERDDRHGSESRSIGPPELAAVLRRVRHEVRDAVSRRDEAVRRRGPSAEQIDAFFAKSRSELQSLLTETIQEPVTRAGLDLKQLRQGSFFTRTGKHKVPGTSSHSSPRSLMELMVKMEQGKLVDPFSSLELKRLLYVTERRIRYASSPALRGAAVYFKSGSLYSCKPEPDFKCRKYQGNKKNLMNSVAVVESPAGEPRPPAPTSRTREALSRSWPSRPTSGITRWRP